MIETIVIAFLLLVIFALVAVLICVLLWPRKKSTTAANIALPTDELTPAQDQRVTTLLNELAKDFDRVNLPLFGSLFLSLTAQNHDAAYKYGRELQTALRHPDRLKDNFAGFQSHLDSLTPATRAKKTS